MESTYASLSRARTRTGDSIFDRILKTRRSLMGRRQPSPAEAWSPPPSLATFTFFLLPASNRWYRRRLQYDLTARQNWAGKASIDLSFCRKVWWREEEREWCWYNGWSFLFKYVVAISVNKVGKTLGDYVENMESWTMASKSKVRLPGTAYWLWLPLTRLLEAVFVIQFSLARHVIVLLDRGRWCN